jgi:predicted transport protein
MDIYKVVNKDKMEIVENSLFDNEKEIQNLIERNLETLFNLKFVKSEVVCEQFRFDTLCWDEENHSFVIVEYKNTKSFSVIDQGYSYLSVMLNNKSDFVLEYNENMDKNIKRENVDWTQSRVIFISSRFNNYQKNSVNFRDVPFELWEIEKFLNGTIGLQQIVSNSKESIKNLENKNDSIVKNVSKEIIKYDDETVVTKYNKDFLSLYEKLKKEILELDDITIKATKNYVCFVKRNKGFVYVNPRKDHLLLDFLYRIDFDGNVKSKPIPFKFKDPDKQFTFHPNKHKENYKHKFTEKSDLDYVMFCLKQKYYSLK